MAKRKAGVQDIIYELDNDDLSGSSDDEHKKSRMKISKTNSRQRNDNVKKVHEHFIKVTPHNGGKNDSNVFKSNSSYRNMVQCRASRNGSVLNRNNEENSNTIIINHDIQIDSSASNNDLSAVDAENKLPLISIRFRDKEFAKLYKRKIKHFMLDLMKKHNTEHVVVDSDTDLELDIWPAKNKENNTEKTSFDDNLFFVDTAPCESNSEVPMYKQASLLISNIQDKKESETQPMRQRFACFNCDGEHQLKDCKKPRNHSRIAEKRRSFGVKLGRYHVEDEQKYGHIIPGRISGQLRHALGIRRYELPLYIYRMRLLGYPCGWMEEAKILPSGINMFDSTGTRILDPGEEEGEVFEKGTKDSYDIKKIHDFPGFNVPTSSTYIEESHLYGLPTMSEQDSKFIMLERLAPNAMKAYKRKKLTFFPSSANTSQEGQTEMELDSGDEIAVFPSVPPLPDDEPPKLPLPPPPPPDQPPSSELPHTPKSDLPNNKFKLVETKASLSKKQSIKEKSAPARLSLNDDSDKSLDVIEIIEEIEVPDIPIPEDDLIIIDCDDEISLNSSRNSPSIDDLEAKKQLLLDAIMSSEIATDSGTDIELSKDVICEDKLPSIVDESIESIGELVLLKSGIANDPLKKEIRNRSEQPQTTYFEPVAIVSALHTEGLEPVANEPKPNTEKPEPIADNPKPDIEEPEAIDDNPKPDTEEPEPIVDNPKPDTEEPEPITDEPKKSESSTAEVKTGNVKDTLYGAPVMNIASPFIKLPSDDKFSKDICDIINFENLPNSVGKYKKICSLLKKVKSEVDRIQES